MHDGVVLRLCHRGLLLFSDGVMVEVFCFKVLVSSWALLLGWPRFDRLSALVPCDLISVVYLCMCVYLFCGLICVRISACVIV